MKLLILSMLSTAALVTAQFVPPPAPVLLTSTKSGVLPVLPTPFTGVDTLEGAIIKKAPVNLSYVPVNGPAQVQSNLPSATYTAILPNVAFNELTGTVIKGSITGSSKQGDTGVTWTVTLTNFPNVTQYGPFGYHVHNMPVPADGNCTSTLGHFDYTNAGEYYTCSTTNPQNCQTGDLAGKHGKVNGTTFTTTFVDNYLSTDPSSPYFFGSKSIVIHTSNTTRLTCANFVMVAAGGTGTNATQSATRTGAPISTFSGAAGKVAAGGAVGAAALLVGLII